MDKKIILNRMKHNPFFIIGSIVIVFLLVVCFLSPMYVQYSPTANDVANKFLAPGFTHGLKGCCRGRRFGRGSARGRISKLPQGPHPAALTSAKKADASLAKGNAP